MTKQNLTPPYPTSIKPVRDGVYAVSTPNSKGNKFAYYDDMDLYPSARRISAKVAL